MEAPVASGAEPPAPSEAHISVESDGNAEESEQPVGVAREAALPKQAVEDPPPSQEGQPSVEGMTEVGPESAPTIMEPEPMSGTGKEDASQPVVEHPIGAAERFCQHCGAAVEMGSGFCGDCGTPQD